MASGLDAELRQAAPTLNKAAVERAGRSLGKFLSLTPEPASEQSSRSKER